jgi:DNA repair exonuclease SbcCD ATPase subunit
MRTNTELKEKCNKEYANTLEATKKLKECQADVSNARRTIKDMEQTCQALNADNESTKAMMSERVAAVELKLINTQGALEQLSTQSVNTEASLKQTISQQQYMLSEANVKIESLQSELRTHGAGAADDLQRHQAMWNDETLRMKETIQIYATKLQKLESERSSYVANKREIDTAKAKIVELEDKIRRQDHYMKSRLLKDRTNTLHAPDVSVATDMLKVASSSSSLSSSGGSSRHSTGGLAATNMPSAPRPQSSGSVTAVSKQSTGSDRPARPTRPL